MEKEFLNKLKDRCDSLGIDIDILGDSELLLKYNGITFHSDIRRKAMNVINSFESFIENMK